MNYDAWLERPFQDACDLADKWEEVEEQYLKTEQYRKAYADWASADPADTEEMFRESARYEYLLEQYADDLWEREQGDE